MNTLRLSNEFFAYECRDGDQCVAVALNLSDTEQSFDPPEGLTSLLTGQNGPGGRPPGRTLTVPAHEWVIVSAPLSTQS